ncbi:MAG: phosphatidylglycerophosphatase A [Planctomycetota bacterium]
MGGHGQGEPDGDDDDDVGPEPFSTPGGVEVARLSPTLWFATGFGAGYGKPGPGTRGSLVGLMIAWAVTAASGSAWAVPVSAALACGFGIPICAAGVKHFGREDPPEVVWDEIAGMLVVFAFVPLEWWSGSIGFALFRLYDIWKPPMVAVGERLPGAWGVMADDISAGVITAGLLYFGVVNPLFPVFL